MLESITAQSELDFRCTEAVTRGILKKFRKIYRKTLVRESLFNKVASLSLATLLKKRLWYRCFPVNFAKFLRTLILKNICKLPLDTANLLDGTLYL